MAQQQYERVMRDLDTAVAGLSPSRWSAFVAGATLIEQDKLVRRLLSRRRREEYRPRTCRRCSSNWPRTRRGHTAPGGAQMPADDLHDVVESMCGW